MTVDMSPQGIATRLKRVSQLRRLCLSLKQTDASSRNPEGRAKTHEEPEKNDSEREEDAGRV